MKRTETANPGSVPARRLHAQRITGSDFSTSAEVVGWLAAVQAQDYHGAKWALGLRLPPGTADDAAVERALARGTILRTHAMRWTWHFVSPADLPWILDLVAPRLIARHARRHRQLGLDEATFRRSAAVIARALGNGGELTREELGRELERARIAASGPRLSHLLGRAELEAVVCSGARRGKRATYALFDRRVPRPRRPLEHGEALGELARRYFSSRGPATLRDFVWWSGLSAAEARAGLAAAGSALASETRARETWWQSAGAPAARASQDAHLLPAFDEYLTAYRNRDAMVAAGDARRLNAGGGMLTPAVVVGGRVVGTWRREIVKRTVTVDLDLFGPVTNRVRQAIAEAARRYGEFLGLDVRLGITTGA